MDETQAVLREVAREREKQITQWGSAFDDENSQQDWAAFIMHYTASGITERAGRYPAIAFRTAMLKVAALAVAAIEAHDRKL